MASIMRIIGDTVGKTFQQDKQDGVSDNASSWKTRSGTDSGSVISYAMRVSSAFALTAAMTVLILVTVLAVAWDNQFQNYTHANIKRIAEDTAASLAETYNFHGGWSIEANSQLIYTSSITNGLGFQLLDDNGVPLFDNTWVSKSEGNPPAVLGHTGLTPSRSSMESAPVIDRMGNQVGTVRVWAFGSEQFLTQNDIAFRANSYRAIFIAAVVAVMLALILGFLFSRGLVNPVRKVAATAEKIKNGDLSARTKLVGNDEISQLGEIFDAMANSLEKDRELERRLTTDVAHELRTPLMAILATVEAIQDGVFPADEERLATIGAETRRLSRLVDALLQLSRLESGATKFDYRPHNIVELTKSIATAHEAMVSEAGMSLEYYNETGKEELMVELDGDRIRQAVINLLSNAIRYTDTGGSICVRLKADRRDVFITVQDSGIGISSEDIDRVFSRFWRAEESRNRAQGGLGVGLAVTKEVIDRHRGYIRVESELGVGTSFTIVIPKVQPKHSTKQIEENKKEANFKRAFGVGKLTTPDKEAQQTRPAFKYGSDKARSFTTDPNDSGKHDFTDIREASRKKERAIREHDDELIG